ncbi:MAG: hypothetical protein VSS75_022120 [Candidatus Parabeggiatoa sp.]|nr:hypothetical protein [Candidatus Parabeggiatoa sp.]
MNTQKHTKQIVMIGDGYSDYVVLKQFVSVIFDSLPANENRLNFFDNTHLESLNIGHFVNQFIDKADKTSAYDLFGGPATHFKKKVVETLSNTLASLQKRNWPLGHRDLLIICSDSEKPLGKQQNYFQEWAYSLEAILGLAIDDFYGQMVKQGYDYEYLPLVLPLIFFPSIEILVAACTEEVHDFDKQCRALKAKPDLKQKVWGTDSIDEALKSGMLHGVLETYMTPEALNKVYKTIPEVRRFIQLLRFNVL